MKTQTTKVSSKKVFGGTVNKTKKVTMGMMLIAFTLFSYSGKSQTDSQIKKTRVGTSMGVVVTGDGFGKNYNPMLRIGYKRSSFSIGTLIQAKNKNASGLNLNYEYTIFGETERAFGSVPPCEEIINPNLDLFVFATAMYQANAYLSNTFIEREKAFAPESSTNFESLRFKSYEGYAGFGLRIKCFNTFKIFGNIGAGGYVSKNASDFDVNDLEHMKKTCVLIMKAGISYSIK